MVLSFLNYAYFSSLAYTVSPQDSVLVTPNYIIAEPDSAVEFTCSALGGPDNLFHWVFDKTEEVFSQTKIEGKSCFIT